LISFGRETICPDEQSLVEFAHEFSNLLVDGDVCLLRGEVGAGKTFFSTHVYAALGGHPRLACSPSFTLVNVYPLPEGKEMFHVDLYRLDGVIEEDELDQDSWMSPMAGFSFIEWPERLDGWLPTRGYEITLKHLDEGRSIEIAQI
jgi:tRNA threonylcarbamoyl adenosine modification protein YjeE